MRSFELKLKQASAVLGVAPKVLQNLVQFKVLRPPRRGTFYWFDNRLLLEAKVAFYLKESLGTSIEVLTRFTQALSSNLKEAQLTRPRHVWRRSRPARSREPIEVRIPFVDVRITSDASPDPDDNPFCACAEQARAALIYYCRTSPDVASPACRRPTD